MYADADADDDGGLCVGCAFCRCVFVRVLVLVSVVVCLVVCVCRLVVCAFLSWFLFVCMSFVCCFLWLVCVVLSVLPVGVFRFLVLVSVGLRLACCC